MCLLPSDLISDWIRKDGYWQNCPEVDASALNNAPFLDIGANIGACSIQVLAFTKVNRVLMFEPNPFTFSYLANTLDMFINDFPEFADRLDVFQYGLGIKDENHTIFIEPGNAGNAIVGK